MSKKIAFFIENGSEELEIIAPLDILRRGGVEVDLISANDKDKIVSSHNVSILVDKKISDVENILDYDGIVVPGGMPGSEYLKNNSKVIQFFKDMYEQNRLVAAICAAPIVLDEAGITKDKKVTSYPGFDSEIEYKEFSNKDAVVVDGNVITAQGPALAMLFGYAILEYLQGEDAKNSVANPMLIDVLKNNI
ncbi:DJ-1/PfpI family protein [Gemella sp. GH3]|uniref:DJ-1 family glyoxalase III n=1 Tax=unclassified Gemella TaxID=2624949 RepID=UPI0015D0BD42|nr:MULTISPECIES: DJ-1 family glyoxalase III [unclassified Gemella]MBF0713697.1 DJ-1/PfpI family protein [Gemella sp. GH3.1]NYS50649.1 DJ-1/PfpI family protein [Gemella sp. GH3]